MNESSVNSLWKMQRDKAPSLESPKMLKWGCSNNQTRPQECRLSQATGEPHMLLCHHNHLCKGQYRTKTQKGVQASLSFLLLKYIFKSQNAQIEF